MTIRPSLPSLVLVFLRASIASFAAASKKNRLTAFSPSATSASLSKRSRAATFLPLAGDYFPTFSGQEIRRAWLVCCCHLANSLWRLVFRPLSRGTDDFCAAAVSAVDLPPRDNS